LSDEIAAFAEVSQVCKILHEEHPYEARSGSIWSVRQAVEQCPLFARSGRSERWAWSP